LWLTATALSLLLARPALANHVDTATINATCDSYTIEVTASELTPGASYSIEYSIIGFPSTITGSIDFTALSSTFDSGPITRSIGPFTGTFTLTGSVTLVGENTISATITPTTVTCGTPPQCPADGSISSGFNGTAIVGVGNGPAYVWFNSNISLKNLPAGKSVTLTGSQVTINGTAYAIPDAHITFAAVSCATTSFDAGSNTWNTIVPVAGSDEIFLSGAAIPVSSLPGGAAVTWSGTFATDQPGVCISWKWGAAAYTSWPLSGSSPDYNAAAIKPAHSAACGMNNGDHAGTPQNLAVRQSVTGGARGGGGSNFTGSWSGTGHLCPVCPLSLSTDLFAYGTSSGQPASGAATLDRLSLGSPSSPAGRQVEFSVVVPQGATGPATLRIHDAAGRLLAGFDLSGRTGRFTIRWDGTDRAGNAVGAGVYFASLTAGGERALRTVIIR
jgi:hypothetical protein